MATVGKPLTDS